MNGYESVNGRTHAYSLCCIDAGHLMKNMPLGKDVEKNFVELYRDNKKKGKARGYKGKPRSKEQIAAIAFAAARRAKKK